MATTTTTMYTDRQWVREIRPLLHYLMDGVDRLECSAVQVITFLDSLVSISSTELGLVIVELQCE